MDALDYLELLAHELFEIAAFENEKIFVSLEALDYRAHLVAPLSKSVLNGIADVILYSVRLILRQLVKVIYYDDAGYRTRCLVFLADSVIIGHVKPIGYAHERAVLLGIVIADEVAVELVAAVIQLEERRILRFSLHEPLAAEFGDIVRNACVKSARVRADHIEEHIVAPDYSRIIKPKDGYRKRELHKGVVLRVFRVIGELFHIGLELLFALAAHNERIYGQRKRYARFGRGKLVQLEVERGGGKDEHEDKIHSYSRLYKSFQIFIHRPLLRSRFAVYECILRAL